MGKFENLVGNKYGRLTVIERAQDYISPKGYRAIMWRCLCDCGKETVVRASYLKRGAVRSCGCFKVTNPGRLTHGAKGTRLYNIWRGMKRRCYNTNDASYKNYGGRGISVCDEWKHNFEAFRDWSLEHGYSDNLSIDRIKNNEGYSPSNCRWADNTTQANNTRSNHIVTYDGVSQTIAQWSAQTGIGYHKLKDRINRCKWDTERALTTP